MNLYTYCHPFSHMRSDGFWTVTQPTGLKICKVPENIAKKYPLTPFHPNTGSEETKANSS